MKAFHSRCCKCLRHLLIYFKVRNFREKNLLRADKIEKYKKLTSADVFTSIFCKNKPLRMSKYIQPKRVFGNLSNL